MIPFLIPPIVYRAAAVLLAAAALFAAGWFAYNHALNTGRDLGRAEVQGKWDAEKLKVAAEIDALKTRQAKVTVEVETVYVDRVRVIRERGETIIKEVTKYVPSNTPALPGGFRLYHDAAASGSALPDPGGVADAAAVPAQDVAVTVAANYAGCLANAEQVKAWQGWAQRQMQAIGSVATPQQAGPPPPADHHSGAGQPRAGESLSTTEAPLP